jgi:hypothetical protein
MFDVLYISQIHCQAWNSSYVLAAYFFIPNIMCAVEILSPNLYRSAAATYLAMILLLLMLLVNSSYHTKERQNE